MSSIFAPSRRSLRYSGPDSLADVNIIVDDDIYHPVSNPDGIINLGTTINPLMSDIVDEFLRTRYKVHSELAIMYNHTSGSPALRATVADLINRHFTPSKEVQPQNVIAANGLTGLINSLAYTLLEDNESILMPTPAYNLLVTATEKRNDIHCVFADTEDIDQFCSTDIDDYLAAFSAAIDQASDRGNPVKAILLCNPHNPLGRCYERKVLKAVLEFCHRGRLHLIVDEIYALSALDGSFCSALSLEALPTDNVHVLYGISKDWGFNGLRLGFMISRNKLVLDTMKQAVGRFTRFSSLSEQFYIDYLSDTAFIDDVYLPTLRRRIRATKSVAESFLSDVHIPYTPSCAGFFLWVDLRRWICHFPATDDQETPEIQLAHHLIQHRVFLQPTKAFVTKQQGHFRFSYSRDQPVLQEGLRRLGTALAALEPPLGHKHRL
ncbi:PLP-dependent transferase [Penicillium hordei]|uniref:PLP-dependent transferase n=1 Tax=Penicillium hordei TaxID=40994 RepID=A0AAD6EA01_9EURO|nr:PLP-dependent transferase [Penicillium hordei]KAJ5604114.1 PLP-dependent transferase [Penicillium hordei]